ncbi:MAG: HAD family hydrolase [Hyphomicrobiales bacterium]|nr:MAG: HAD family hydrolase [Hyphomicrobiales bacterium]
MKLILFDADGTLVDSQAVIHDSMVQTFVDFGYDVPKLEATRSIVGLSLNIAIATMLGRDTDAQTAEMTEKYKSNFNDIMHQPKYASTLFPGIKELIETLAEHDDILIGMVTGKSRKGINHLLDDHDFHPHFITSRCADDCPSKPHPAMVLECCDEVGVAPERTYVIGDTSFDIEMAKSAGATAIGVSWGYHDVDILQRAGADKIIDKAHEVHGILDLNRKNVHA